MNGKVAKKLRRIAEKEQNNKPYRLLMTKQNKSIINSINSIRGFYLRLKDKYKRI